MSNERRDGPIRSEARHNVDVIREHCDLMDMHIQPPCRVSDGVDHVPDVSMTNAPRSEPRVPCDVGIDAVGFVCHSALG
jgi:hypothetical protein